MNWIKISLICVIIGIGYLSLFPRQTNEVNLPINDKIGHGIAYCILIINAGLIVKKKLWIKLGISAFLYSLLLEGLQYFVPGRSSEIYDLIANSIGIIVGFLILSKSHGWLLNKILNK